MLSGRYRVPSLCTHSGSLVGDSVGSLVGDSVGDSVGALVGASVGASVGALVDDSVGVEESSMQVALPALAVGFPSSISLPSLPSEMWHPPLEKLLKNSQPAVDAHRSWQCSQLASEVLPWPSMLSGRYHVPSLCTHSVGDSVGDSVGESVGLYVKVGDCVGDSVGAALSTSVMIQLKTFQR